jgi:hypothetical protein
MKNMILFQYDNLNRINLLNTKARRIVLMEPILRAFIPKV